MPDTGDTTTQLTLTDIDVGSRLVEALVQHAISAQGAPISHEDLLTLARKLHPRDATLGRAVPVGIGMKLRFVDAFCSANAYPRLASLAVNKATMLPKDGDLGVWEADRQAVAAFDWTSAGASLTTFAAEMRAKVPKRLKPRKERPADVAWYAYFCSHREACARVGAEEKIEIINLLMSGLDPETALGRVMAAKTAMGL
jgi:hypothetical protein